MVAECVAIGHVLAPGARRCQDCGSRADRTMRITRTEQGERVELVVCVDRDGCRARRARQLVEAAQ